MCKYKRCHATNLLIYHHYGADNGATSHATTPLPVSIVQSYSLPFTDSNYGSRIRFMIQDVVDLRQNNWVPRRVQAKPQRIEDIHREFAKEEEQKKLEAQAATKAWKSKKKAQKRSQNNRK